MLTFLGPEKYEVKDVRYTTCVADNNDWYLTSADVELDQSRLVGTAHNATIYFKGVPILYSPYLSFPLSNERKTGFLTPVYGSSNQRGFEVALPYYLNLAPNYDATLLARPMTPARPADRRTSSAICFRRRPARPTSSSCRTIASPTPIATRWRGSTTRISATASRGFVNVQKVSDDTYFADLSDRLALTSQTNLPRDYGLTYNKGPLSLLGRMQSFQTLQDPNNPITPPYFREPQLTMTVKPVEWQGLDFGAAGEFVRFHQPALIPTAIAAFCIRRCRGRSRAARGSSPRRPGCT